MRHKSDFGSGTGTDASTPEPSSLGEPSADHLATGPSSVLGGSPERDARAILAGLACGLVVGATLGLLLAPQRGRDSRAWIAQQGREARRRAGKFLDPSAARAIIRERGVRGLLDALRRTPQATDLDTSSPKVV